MTGRRHRTTTRRDPLTLCQGQEVSEWSIGLRSSMEMVVLLDRTRTYLEGTQ